MWVFHIAFANVNLITREYVSLHKYTDRKQNPLSVPKIWRLEGVPAGGGLLLGQGFSALAYRWCISSPLYTIQPAQEKEKWYKPVLELNSSFFPKHYSLSVLSKRLDSGCVCYAHPSDNTCPLLFCPQTLLGISWSYPMYGWHRLLRSHGSRTGPLVFFTVIC